MAEFYSVASLRDGSTKLTPMVVTVGSHEIGFNSAFSTTGPTFVNEVSSTSFLALIP